MTVVIVSDYSSGVDKSWHDMRAALRAWAQQDFDRPADFVLAESAAYEGKLPSDLFDILPKLRVEFSAARTSYGLKNHGVRAAQTPLVAIVDADCIPNESWLTRLMAAFERYPDAAAVSGRTIYPGRSTVERMLALLSRSYLDPGGRGSTRFISGNAAGFKREVFLKHALPEDHGAFASRLQSEAMLRAGANFRFEPGMVVVHDFLGWLMERDIRRNIGYGTIRTRLHDSRLPYAWLTRLGVLSVPLITSAKTFDSWRDCLRCSSNYGVRWFELPATFVLAVVVNLLEVPGMLDAFRGRVVVETEYR